MTGPGIIIDGASLTCAGVAAVARDDAPVTVAPDAVAAARAAWETARDVTARRPVYGRTTGVGANRSVGLAEDDLAEHGLRLLRSHAAGAGPLQPADLGRAMLVIRLNQIGAGGSGVDPGGAGGARGRPQPGVHPARAAVRGDRHRRPDRAGVRRAVPDRRASLAHRHRAAAAVPAPAWPTRSGSSAATRPRSARPRWPATTWAAWSGRRW